MPTLATAPRCSGAHTLGRRPGPVVYRFRARSKFPEESVLFVGIEHVEQLRHAQRAAGYGGRLRVGGYRRFAHAAEGVDTDTPMPRWHYVGKVRHQLIKVLLADSTVLEPVIDRRLSDVEMTRHLCLGDAFEFDGAAQRIAEFGSGKHGLSSRGRAAFGNAYCVNVGNAYTLGAMDGLDRAVAVLGSQAELARRLKIQSPSISEWRKRGRVPVERCRDIVDACDGAVSLSDLRPDIWPPQKSRAVRVA